MGLPSLEKTWQFNVNQVINPIDVSTDRRNLWFNSSTYSEAAYNISGINDSYLFSIGGHLAIVAGTATKTIKFATGGTTSTNLRMTLSDTALTMNSIQIKGLTTPTASTDAATKGYIDGYTFNASGLKSATTVVSVSSATAPSSGQVLTATSSTAATWQTPTGGSSGPLLIQNFAAPDFDDPGSDWAVTSPAALNTDLVNAAVLIRRFDDTTSEGVGWTVRIPATCTQVKFTFMSKAMTAPGGTRTVGLSIKAREVPDNSTLSSWISTTLTDISIPTNVTFQRDTQTITLSTLSYTADRFYQMELVRQNPSGGTELTGDWGLFFVMLEWLV